MRARELLSPLRPLYLCVRASRLCADEGIGLYIQAAVTSRLEHRPLLYPVQMLDWLNRFIQS